MTNKTHITGNGYYCSPNMVQFCKDMVAKELLEAYEADQVRAGLRPAPPAPSYYNVSDRH